MSAIDRPPPPTPPGRAPPGRAPADRALRFTIVVPTRARPQRLTACLAALARLTYERERAQVVIVDDGSPESPHDIVEGFCPAMDVELVVQGNAGPAAARNAGAARARHEYLAFTDDDCQPEPEWLAALAAGFGVAPRAMLGGSTVNALSNNVFSEASQDLVSYLYEYYNDPAGGEDEIGRATFLPSNNMALPTDLFHDLGGFSASFPLAAAEDRDLCERWLAAGHEMRYVPRARVRHSHELDLPRFWRQHLGYGRGAYAYHRRRALRAESRMRPEPLRFYTGLLKYPLVRGARARAPALSLLLAISQVANVLGYFLEGWRRRRGRSVGA